MPVSSCAAGPTAGAAPRSRYPRAPGPAAARPVLVPARPPRPARPAPSRPRRGAPSPGRTAGPAATAERPARQDAERPGSPPRAAARGVPRPPGRCPASAGLSCPGADGMRRSSGRSVQFPAQAVDLAWPGEIDHLDEGELPAAVRAVGEPDPASFRQHLEPRAGRVRPDGQHVPEYGLPVRQVPLLMPAVEQHLPGVNHAPTPRLRGIEY